MLSGCPPFFGKSKAEIYTSIVRDVPKFGRVRGRLSPQAIEFTMMCLDKDPSKRATAE